MNWEAFWLVPGLFVGIGGFVVGLVSLAVWLEDRIGAWSILIPIAVILLLVAVGAGLTVAP